MSDNGMRLAQPPAVQAELKIQLMADGQIQLSGPLSNKLLVYGMLECAKDAIRDLGTKAEKPLVAPVTLMPKFGN